MANIDNNNIFCLYILTLDNDSFRSIDGILLNIVDQNVLVIDVSVYYFHVINIMLEINTEKLLKICILKIKK
jgi:hypothetical protein